MVNKTVFVYVVAAALVCASEIEDAEQKNRGAGKANSLNAIPTGAQKSEYTYSIYQQNQSAQNSPSPTYQSQVANSFYPSQGSSQYYTSSNTPHETPSYSPQPQLNLLPPQGSSQFVPLNFQPNPGYQSRYQLVPSKTSNGNLQLSIIPQSSSYQPSQVVPYSQTLFSPSPNPINPHQNPLLTQVLPQGHFNVAPPYQPLSLGSPYLGQPSAMVFVAQPNPSLYNNILYPNPVQSFYNYYPSNSQAKYSITYGSQPQPSADAVSQNIPKEDNDIGIQNNEYLNPSESNPNYKNVYAAPRTSYSKLT